MSKILKRYEKLRLREYEIDAHYYPFVCKELSLILRNAYSKAPKNLQSILFEDTVAAFRFLPQVEIRAGMEAANLLHQAAESALPKQRKVLAVSEFKHAVVAYKRRLKSQKDVEGLPQLPQDVLFHIFSFLDIRSLVIAGLVCWSWNSTANDNNLWQSQYEVFFGGSYSSEPPQKSISFLDEKYQVDMDSFDWREDFKQTFIANSSRRFSSNRGYCGICKSVVWLSNMKCPNKHLIVKTSRPQIDPVLPQQIVEHLLGRGFSTYSSSDSDSDSDDFSDSDSEIGSSSKLWDYKRQLQNFI